jgi:hypothetical protein
MNKRFLAFAAAVIMALCAVMPAAAQDEVPGHNAADPYYSDSFTVTGEDRSSYFDSYALTISSPHTGQIKTELSVTAVQSMKKLGFTSLTLYHWSGGSWETVMTVTDQYLTNTDYFSYTTTRTGLSSGHVYRVTVELYAKKGFLQTQTLTLTSDSMVCR